jgi:hypothetical protein
MRTVVVFQDLRKKNGFIVAPNIMKMQKNINPTTTPTTSKAKVLLKRKTTIELNGILISSTFTWVTDFEG